MTIGAQWCVGAAVATLVATVGCGGYDTPTSPTTDPRALAEPSPAPRAPLSNDLFVRTAAGLSGLVFETTPSGGYLPIPGVSVYCDACGEQGHTTTTTDASGFYRFSGDIASGGGVWVAPGYTTYLIVRKDGYGDPAGLPTRFWGSEPGLRELTMRGDSRLDIELVRRR